jgi:PAS domain S-box-containing protein
MKNFSDLKQQVMERIENEETNISGADACKLKEIENLHIYQIELEIQNEELVNSREQLEKSQKYLSDLFHHAPVGYIILSIQNIILDLNLMATQIFGFQKKSMMNQRFQSYVPQQSIISFKKCFTDLIRTKEKQSSEIQFVGKNGRRLWGKMTISTLDHPDDGPQILCALVDITHEKETQQSINALQFLKELLHVIPLPVFYTDPQGKLIGFNKCFVNYTGLNENQLLQSQASDILLKDVADKSGIIMDTNKMDLDKIYTYEIDFQHADRSFRSITLKLAGYVNLHYGLSGIIGVMVDITSHRILQQDLEASIEKVHIYAQKAEMASIAKGQFLANMSHEIRTPMNAILGMLEIVHTTTELTDDQDEYIQIAYESAQNLLVIINDILDFSKIEAQKVTIHNQDFDLFELIRSFYQTMRIQASQKTLDFLLDIHPDVNQYWQGDPYRIRQILVNIVANAIKFTDKGSVSIYISQQDIEYPEDAALLCFEISDTGSGIQVDKQDLIFDSFTQGDGSHTRRYGGTGLGLTISKQLCELMGGKLSFKSTTGKGTTFYFQLNLKPVQQPVIKNDQKSIPPNDPESPIQIRHVLLAEDISSNVKVATLFLSRLGIKATVAKDGFEVIEILKNSSFDCILMDIEMPGMSGFETTNRIRAGEAGNQHMNIPIIAMTAHAITGFDQKCVQSGMDGYISKPIRLEKLKQVLSQFKGSQIKPASKQAYPSQIISIQQLIEEFNDATIIDEILKESHQDLTKFMKAIDEAYQKGDYNQLAFLVHSVKGLAENIGANELIQIAKHFEKNLRNDNLDMLASAFSDIQRAIQDVVDFIFSSRLGTCEK